MCILYQVFRGLSSLVAVKFQIFVIEIITAHLLDQSLHDIGGLPASHLIHRRKREEVIILIQHRNLVGRGEVVRSLRTKSLTDHPRGVVTSTKADRQLVAVVGKGELLQTSARGGDSDGVLFRLHVYIIPEFWEMSSAFLEKIRNALKVTAKASKQDASLTDYRAHKIVEEEDECYDCDVLCFHVCIIPEFWRMSRGKSFF